MTFMLRTLLTLSLSLVFLPFANGQDSDADQLKQLIDQVWNFDLQESPVFATRVGVHRYNDQLGNQTLADHRRRLAARLGFELELQEIDRTQLSRTDQINYDVFGRLLRVDIDEAKFGAYLIPITNRSGFHVSFPELAKQVPLNSITDYENYIARLQAFKRYVGEHLEVMRAGIEARMVLPAVVLEGWRDSVVTHIVEDPERSLLYVPFQEMPDRIAAADQQRLAAAGRQAITSSVVAGYQAFLDFMEQEYVPACRGSIGAAALPKGREFYQHRVRRFTTLEVTPEQVHETGLAEVKRIRAEMATVIDDVNFEGDFAAFVDHLRTDPKFYPKSAEELKKETAYVLKKMDGELPRLFKTLPRTPYGIREVPAYIAPQNNNGVLPAARRRWQPGRFLLHQHLQLAGPAVIWRRGAVAARSGSWPSPANRAATGADRVARLPPLRRYHGIRGRLGVVFRATGFGSWILSGPLQ